MEERSNGPVAAPVGRLHFDGNRDAQVAHGPNRLAVKIPLRDGSVDNGLPSPLPTPPAPEDVKSRAPTQSIDLPTIQSDEDYASSPSSSKTNPDRHDVSEPSSVSDSTQSPKLAATAIDGSGDLDRDNMENEPMRNGAHSETVRRLSAADMQYLTASQHSLPIAVVPNSFADERNGRLSPAELHAIRQSILLAPHHGAGDMSPASASGRSHGHPRTLSTPPINRSRRSSVLTSPRRNSFHPLPTPMNYRSQPPTPVPAHAFPDWRDGNAAHDFSERRDNNGMQPRMPLVPIPPISLPTHLQLELAAEKPSPLYIERPQSVDAPYESSAVKIERLKNVVLVTPFLERTLTFGALACLDSWLYTFTILPLRFLVALWILAQWWGHVIAKEARWVGGYVWYGLGRLWLRARHGRRRNDSVGVAPSEDDKSGHGISYDFQHDGVMRTPSLRDSHADGEAAARRRVSGSHHRPRPGGAFRHRRTKSKPSNLSTFNKADLLQGAIVLFSAMALMKLDASRMYHFIRAQSDIKLYVIYNVLEVADRLLGAIGQDILECLFSSETLSRNSSGRSKVLLPLGMFLMALAYNVTHATALYFQCITLNVAVNSYSNALLTLLMSNQFVEVKSTVFKRFEKDNLFQLTCADIVERFQLWVMLLIIGMRNVVEVGGLSVPGAGVGGAEPSSTIPLHSPTILPHSFTVLPTWLLSGEVLSPFLIVIGSEVFVDAIKHAYINKFNNIKPRFYGRILDILCKDYYTNAFTTPSLTRRLGLPVIPLSCLFIRASFQTYHMFLSTRLSPPLPASTHTALTSQSVPTSPAVTAALERFDALIRDALGRSVYGDPLSMTPKRARPWWHWTGDDAVAALTMLVFFFLVFLVLLMVKLALGMVLLHYSRSRYASMRARENEVARGRMEREEFDAGGVRKGGWGCIEVGPERSAWIGADPSEGLKKRKKAVPPAEERSTEAPSNPTAFNISSINGELNEPIDIHLALISSIASLGTRNIPPGPLHPPAVDHDSANSEPAVYEPAVYEPANDDTMADARSLLRQQQASRRITHPHALYSTSGKLSCALCQVPVKTEALWDAHIRSPSHREALQALAAAREQEKTGEASGVKRKHEEEEDEEAEDEERRKRTRAGVPALTSGASSASERSGSRASNTPSQGVEVSIPSRPATPKAAREGPAPSATTPLQGKAAVDEAEWAAFEADIAAATEPYDESAVISAPAAPVGGTTEAEGGEEGGKKGREAEVEGEREEAQQALAEEFDEMEELEARAKKLRERREALRARASRGDLNAGADGAGAEKGSEKGVDKENAAAGEEGEEDESEDEEDDYAWGGLRYAGRV